MPILFDQPFQILLDLAREKKIDPWEVDIEKLTHIYANQLNEIKEHDLRTSGRAIYSASTILRMKANQSPYDGESEDNGEELPEELTLGLPELGPLTVIRRSPRKITLPDLVSTLQETLKEPKNESVSEKSKVENIKRMLDKYHLNIGKHIMELHEKIAELAPNGELINLIELCSENNKLGIVRVILLALFLCNDGKISIHQEEPFGDIYVKLEKEPVDNNGD